VRTNDGGCSSRKSRPKGDPENTLTRPELEDKAVRLEPMPRRDAQDMKSIIARYALHDEKSGAISCRGPLTANCRSPARRVSGRSAVTRARFFALSRQGNKRGKQREHHRGH